MSRITDADRFGAGLEWKLSLGGMLWGVPAAVASFALPAWAVKATSAFEQYAPLSWVLAGFAGLLLGAVTFATTAWARAKWVRSKYDSRMLAQGGALDPLEKTFERKRIYLNEFCLPSHPFIDNKAFIDCEIIGPANIIFVQGNSITDPRYPLVDAVYMEKGCFPSNGYAFKDCIFRGCNFTRVTFLVQHEETTMFQHYPLIKWLTAPPAQVQLGDTGSAPGDAADGKAPARLGEDAPGAA